MLARSFAVVTAFLLSMGAWASEFPTIFVIDLDDTLVRDIRPGEPATALTDLVPRDGSLLEGHQYRVLDGAREFVGSLEKDYPNAQIVFYSGGPKVRNEGLLQEMTTPSGKSFEKVKSLLLSFTDLTFRGEKVDPRELRGGYDVFNDKVKKKDLLKVIPQDLSPEDQMKALGSVIWIDDNPNYVHLTGTHEERNLLWIGHGPKRYQETLTAKGSVPEFIQDRNKLARARGMIDRVMEESKRSGQTPRDVLWKMQWNQDDSGAISYKMETFSDASLYRAGRQRFAEVNPEYRFTPASYPERLPLGCVRAGLAGRLLPAR